MPVVTMCDAYTCRWADTASAKKFRPSHSQKSGVRWTQDMILGVLSIYVSCSIA